MKLRSKAPFNSSLDSFSQIASVIVAAVGALVLVGWMLDIGTLKSVWPGLATMKPNTALAFILAGLCLYLQLPEQTPQRNPVIAQGCAGMIALIGFLTLSEYQFGWDLGVDQMLLKDPETPPDFYPGRMSVATALNFLILGVALVLLDVETSQGHRPAQWLGLVAALLSLLGIVGYAYGAQALYRVAPYSSLGLHTAVAFLALSIGLLCARPEKGLMAIVSGKSLGSLAARRLLPTAILIPFVAGWLRLVGQRAGLYQTEFGLALMVVVSIIALVVLIGWTARLLDRLEAARRREEAKFRDFTEFAPDSIVAVNSEGRIVLVNRQTERIFGYRQEELLGKPLEILLPERFREVHVAHRVKYYSEPAVRPMGSGLDLYGRRRDGTQVPVDVSLGPLETDDGIVVAAIIRDISRRKRLEEELRTLNQELEQRVVERTAKLEAANKELQAFTYSVSHDLRAPVRHIHGYAELLQKSGVSALDEKSRHYLETILVSGKQMTNLIDDLLSFSRMGQAEMSKIDVSMDELLKEALRNLAPEMNGRSIDWKTDALPQVYGDPTMLRLVLINLVSNALKFTRKRAEAKIEIGSMTNGGDEIVVFVRDNGAGFDMRYVDKLFGIFQRLHRHEEFEGTGIGLANVSRVIHRHGGRTWAEGKVDGGATFYFSLPKSQKGE